MNFLLYIVVAIESVLGVGTSLYLLVSLFGVIIYKIVRKVRYKASLYD